MAETDWGNQTDIKFILLGFGDLPDQNIFLFLLFLVIYITTVAGNTLIIVLVVVDKQLHTPMYFLLGNLSSLETCYTSTILPRMLANLLTGDKTIFFNSCFTQLYFFAELPLLTIMAYDRYVAICQPLHYERVMSKRVCIQMAASAWTSGILYSALHTGNTFVLTFCGGNTVDQFFCEIPQLLKLACSNSYLGETGVIVVSACLALIHFVFIIVSYVLIFKTVLRIPSEQGRHKAFSTCFPHLIVVSLFICTATFAYMKPTSSSASALDLAMAVLYSMVPPMVNPIIYSMRNKDIKAALWKMIGLRQLPWNKMSIFIP
uniref:Olfactory receptor n=1 Tax=Chelydra serpentina TaxID=8475 RepID=A0A8C3SU51_CHESE